MEGQYKVAVYFAGREIPKSPYLVTMAGDPSKVTVDGAGVDGTAALQVNKTTSFDVHTTSEFCPSVVRPSVRLCCAYVAIDGGPQPQTSRKNFVENLVF